MRINQNISAMNTYSRLTAANDLKSASLAKLSSGLRINKAGDDAAGLAISEKMRGQIGGLKQAIRNAQDGISLIQTAEGALNESHSILNRMRTLAVQASTDTNTDADRQEIQKEVNKLTEELSRIAKDTEFNTQKLFGEEVEGTFKQFEATLHIGANQKQNMKLDIADMRAEALGIAPVELVAVTKEIEEVETEVLMDGDKIYAVKAKDGKYYAEEDIVKVDGVDSNPDTLEANDGAKELNIIEIDDKYYGGGIDVSTREGADAAITTIDAAVTKVSGQRSDLGSVQNRLEHTINNLMATSENLSAAESRIRDVDMAEEIMEFTKNNILSQAATAMLAQANQMPNSVLQLLM